MSRMDAAEADAPRNPGQGNRTEREQILTRDDNSTYQAAAEKYACGGGGQRLELGNDPMRPVISEASATPEQRQGALSEVTRVENAYNDILKKYPDGQNISQADLAKFDAVLDHPKVQQSIKMDITNEFSHVRCPGGNRSSVTFPPPAMQGNYRPGPGGQLEVINSKGDYVPLSVIKERLTNGPKARL